MTQTVTVQVAIQERVRTAKGPAWVDIPPIIMVPVLLPRGGGFAATFPLKKGDEGLLIFCDTCFDFWWLNGQSNSATGTQRQNEVRRHYIHDCGFYPGMSSQPNVLANYSTSSMQLRSDDGATVVDVSAAGVAITGEAVALTAATVTATVNGGTAYALMNDIFYQWWAANIYPFLVSKGYAGPAIPLGSETTVLKGQ